MLVPCAKILKLTDGMKGHYSLVNQLERSATSIGANIREAKYAHSKADFAAKLKDGSLKVFDCSKFTVDGEHLTEYLADVDDAGDYVCFAASGAQIVEFDHSAAAAGLAQR